MSNWPFLNCEDRTASRQAAAHYTSAILATCEALANFPHRGVPRDDIRPGLRLTHHKGRTIIAYVIDDARHQVAILNVFYGGRDYKSSLDPKGRP